MLYMEMNSAIVGVQLAFCVLIFFLSDVALGGKFELSDDEIKEIIRTFDLIDKKHNNEITRHEISKAKAVTPSAISDTAFEYLGRAADLRNGKVDFDSYLSAMQHVYLEDLIVEAFADFDQDENGLPPKNILDAIGRVQKMFSNEDILSIIKKTRSNGDGKMNLHVFISNMLEEVEMVRPDLGKIAKLREDAKLSA